jgi:hypothetical protein
MCGVVVALVVVWILLIAACISWISAYATTPGVSPSAPASWPTGSILSRAVSGPTLIMFIHPYCTCTAASLMELRAMIPNLDACGSVCIVLVTEDTAFDLLESGGNWDFAASIPGVSRIADIGGREASRFRVSTSGHVVLFRSDGSLLFSGGITASRGHAGDCIGRRMVLEGVATGHCQWASTPVYGCPLLTPGGEEPVDADSQR